MDVTKSSGSSGVRRGKHGEGHSEGVNDDLYGHWLVPETTEGVHASMISLRYLLGVYHDHDLNMVAARRVHQAAKYEIRRTGLIGYGE